MVSDGMGLIKWECIFLHVNVNSLLPKIEEIRFIARKYKATVIGISKTKLDGTIFDAEIYIEGYSIVRCD